MAPLPNLLLLMLANLLLLRQRNWRSGSEKLPKRAEKSGYLWRIVKRCTSRRSREILQQCGRSWKGCTCRRSLEHASMPMKCCLASGRRRRSLSALSWPEQTRPCRISKPCALLVSLSKTWTRNFSAWHLSAPYPSITTTSLHPYSFSMPSTSQGSNQPSRMRRHSAQLATSIPHLPHSPYTPPHRLCLASSVKGLLTSRGTVRRRRKLLRRRRKTLLCGRQRDEVAEAKEASRLPRKRPRTVGTVQRRSLLAKQVPFPLLIGPHGSRLELQLTGTQTQVPLCWDAIRTSLMVAR